MELENTFVMLKPDSIKRGLIGEIISRIEKKGLKISEIEMKQLDTEFLNAHYAHLADKPFFPDILSYMLSGPVIGMKICGENAIAGIRLLVGATKIEDAIPGTIRGDYALSTTSNLIHASDSVEAAEAELKRFFGN